ncbi:GGDEF domain-containing protein [Lactobacillus delbrueckii]|uniref:GGDEF domain-containing protein n=1 Tax=Lactobacillus delbrueckii TaxID=1584 RepID=UPI003994F25A
MKEKGNRKRVHGLSWQLANEKEAVYAEYLTSEEFAREIASNNLTMGIAVSSLITVIGFLGLFGLNSYYANVSFFPAIPSEWVYLLLLLANLPNLFLLLWLKNNPQEAEFEIRTCFSNLAVNAFLSGLTLYSTQEGSSYFFELVLMMMVICVLPYYRQGRGFALVVSSLFSTMVIILTNHVQVAWQDAYDLFLFYVIGQACIVLRRHWFRESSWYNDILHRANGSLFVSSRTDELTGIYNRLALREDFPNYLNQEVGAAMIDLDNFKRFNDNYGHAYGDLVLTRLGRYLQKDWMSEHLRSYRYGGDEILIIASGLEDGAFGKKLQIFQAEYAKLNQQLKEPATLSIGYATGTVADEGELRRLIQQADDYLYQAKKQGKDQIIGKEQK